MLFKLMGDNSATLVRDVIKLDQKRRMSLKANRQKIRVSGALFVIASFLSLSSCGSGSGIDIYKGFFFGSAVENLGYVSQLSGVESDFRTDSNGTFDYLHDEDILFRIGTLFFPKVNADRYLTAADMTPTGTIDVTSINIERLLLSLDEDLDPENGIKIPEAIVEFAKSTSIIINFSADANEFQAEPGVQLLLNNYTDGRNLVDSSTAEFHLQQAVIIAAERSAGESTVTEFASNGPTNKLDGTDIQLIFSDSYFIDAEREHWFYFESNGTVIQSTTSSRPINQSLWKIEGDQFCNEFDGVFGCRDVYVRGMTYRFTQPDNSEGLETIALRAIDSEFEEGFPPCCYVE